MRIPLSWLREFVDIPVEARKLGDDLTMAGLALDGLETDAEETILELDITTNRVDAMNVYGVAREVSVLYGVPLKPLPLDVAESGHPAADGLEVRIEAPDLCPRFSARVLDVRIAPSPAWIRDRLERVGVRPINNVVDLTNYVMLEMGHPSHAFDLAKLPGACLIARWGAAGEQVTTLDGVARTLPGTPRIGLVASPDGPLALAGIMGGATSEVSDDTRSVALEAAYWDPLTTRRAARALGMHTEASHRFERGADPEGTRKATDRIAHLLQRTGAGTARPGLIDRVASPRPARTAPLRHARVALVLGAAVPEQRSEQILEGLGFSLERQDGALLATIPSWRGDVSREIDLVEEVSRHFGLDRIPSRVPDGIWAIGLQPWQRRERLVREVLRSAGFDEAVNLSFLPDAGVPQPADESVVLRNPLAGDQAVLRRSLIQPGLLATLQTNLRQGRRELRVFELGRVFQKAPRLANEERRLGLLLAGAARPAHWSERPRASDFFDVSGTLTALCDALQVERFDYGRGALPAFLHPGKAATLHHGGAAIGYAGALHPDLLARLELRGDVFVAELRLEELLRAEPAPARFEPPSRFPAVERDLSVVADAGADARELLERARAGGGGLLQSVGVADRYEGPPVPEGKLSLMLALRFQDPAGTLTGERVDEAVAGIVAALRGAGAEIRGE